ncbi:MAG TPA: hypothetical protein VFE34_16440 [Dongiaceae bacterium]|jgi:hypothetical protein|nr:hypothetical protein [Dongiaceae bacterium]
MTHPARPFAAIWFAMRLTLSHLLAVLLIAVWAIGLPAPAKADCLAADGCKGVAAGMADGSCGQKGEACKFAQSCAAQIQKLPSEAAVAPAVVVLKAAFAAPSDDDVPSAFITPETAPPRA